MLPYSPVYTSWPCERLTPTIALMFFLYQFTLKSCDLVPMRRTPAFGAQIWDKEARSSHWWIWYLPVRVKVPGKGRSEERGSRGLLELHLWLFHVGGGLEQTPTRQQDAALVSRQQLSLQTNGEGNK